MPSIVAKIVGDASHFNKTVAGLKGRFRGLSRFLNSTLAPLVGLGAGALSFNKVISDTSKYQTWRAQLETATGSVEGASEALKKLEAFATKTPFAVDEIVETFVRLKNLGLDPSEEALRSYGNTAAAQGKTMIQFAEAIADAVTFEFERLKEFGIKARQSTDSVSFTFRGATKAVSKDAAAIEAYLRQIGDVEFAGAMDRQSNTLRASFSNLAAAVSSLAAKFGEESGLASAISSATKSLTEFINVSGNLTQRPVGELLGEAIELKGFLSEDSSNKRGAAGRAKSRKRLGEIETELKKLAERGELGEAIEDELSRYREEIKESRRLIEKAEADPELTKERLGTRRGSRKNPNFIDVSKETKSVTNLLLKIDALIALRDELLSPAGSGKSSKDPSSTESIVAAVNESVVAEETKLGHIVSQNKELMTQLGIRRQMNELAGYSPTFEDLANGVGGGGSQRLAERIREEEERYRRQIASRGFDDRGNAFGAPEEVVQRTLKNISDLKTELTNRTGKNLDPKKNEFQDALENAKTLQDIKTALEKI